jgi:hypothetical protein
MNQTETICQKSVCISSCEITETTIVLENTLNFEKVWGLKIQFSDGNFICFSDLCTKYSEIQLLKQRLNGVELQADFIQDIVDDYLGEIYGLGFSKDFACTLSR